MATKTLNIAMEERLLKRIDRLVKEEMASRSEYFRRLALADLARRNSMKDILGAGNAKGTLLDSKNEEDVMRKMSL